MAKKTLNIILGVSQYVFDRKLFALRLANVGLWLWLVLFSTFTATSLYANPNVNQTYTYYIPGLASGSELSLIFSDINIQNTSFQNTANITYQYYDANGQSLSFSIQSCTLIAPSAECQPVFDRTVYFVVLSSDQPLSVVVASGSDNPVGVDYIAPTTPTSSIITPLAMRNAFGGFYSNLSVLNVGADTVTTTLKCYDLNGNLQTQLTKNIIIASHTSEYALVSTDLPDGFVGWAQVDGPVKSQLLGQITESNILTGFFTLLNAQSVTANQLYAPTIFNDAFGGYFSGASIVNPNANPITVTLTYHDNSGNALAPVSLTLNSHALASIYHGSQTATNNSGLPIGGLPQNFYGSVQVTSQGGNIAMLVNEIGPSLDIFSKRIGANSSYIAAATGSTVLSLPVVANGGNNLTTGITILNTTNANVTASIQYYKQDGTKQDSYQTFTLAPNASQPFFQRDGGLPTNFKGAAVVTQQNGPANSLIATINAISTNGTFYTYTLPSW